MTGTTAGLLGAAWGLLAAAVALRCRPLPSRTGNLRPRPGRSRGGGLELAGRAVARLAGRRSLAPTSARRLGGAVVAAAALLPVVPLAAVPAAAVAWALPAVRANANRRRALDRMADDVPEAVDLLVLAVGAGLSVHQAVAAVARRGRGPVAAELARVLAEAGRGRRLSDALDDVPSRAGESLRPLVGALTAAERYGAPLVPSLDRLAAETRATARRRAEEGARRVPVKLLFPLVVCVLPAFGLLTVVPLVVTAAEGLRF